MSFVSKQPVEQKAMQACQYEPEDPNSVVASGCHKGCHKLRLRRVIPLFLGILALSLILVLAFTEGTTGAAHTLLRRAVGNDNGNGNGNNVFIDRKSKAN